MPNLAKMKNLTFKDKINAAVMVMILVIACIVPIIVNMVIVERTPTEISIGFPELGVDAFSAVKSDVIVFSTAIILVLRVFHLLHFLTNSKSLKLKEKILTPLNIASGVYLLMVFLSSIFSDYMDIVIQGHSDRFETVFVLFAYIILMLNVVACIKDKVYMHTMIYGLYFTVVFVGIVGFFQYIGRDPFAEESVQRFIMGRYADSITNFAVVFPTVYSTLFNPNSVGVYASLMLPFTLALSLFLPRKSVLKYVSISMLPFLTILVLGSYSLGGVVGSAAGIFMMAVMTVIYYFGNKQLAFDKRKFFTRVMIGIGACVVAFSSVLVIPFFRTRLDDMISKATVSFAIDRDENLMYRSMNTYENMVNIETRYGAFSIVYNVQNDVLEIHYSGGIVEHTSTDTIELSNGNRFSITRSGNVFIYALQGQFLFGIHPDGTIQALSAAMQPIDINSPIRSIGFENHQLLGNSRGFIWSRTFPIILDNLFIGSGPDTYTFAFPQHDIVGKSNALRDPNMIVDKPHNFFMQQAVNTGMISLIALCAIFAMYLYGAVVVCAKRKTDDPFVMALCIAIFSGICGYLAGSMSTDSTVSVAPVFWGMLGLGFAVNRYLQKHHMGEAEL